RLAGSQKRGSQEPMFFRRTKESPPSFEQRLEAARGLGFAIEQTEGPTRYSISRAGCAAVVERSGADGVHFVEKPGILAGGEIAKLEDRGYQNFLVTKKSSHPARAEQLRALHHFDEELRKILKVPSLYNESLGTVSNRYVYDRVEGRE